MNTHDQNIAFVPLGEVARSVKGKKPAVLKEKCVDGMVPYIDIEAFEDGVFKRYTDPIKTVLCDEGDVLMVWDGARAGLVGRGKPGALGSTLAKIDVPHVQKTYLFYFLESLYPIINSRAKGVGIPHVNPELLWSSIFPVVPKRQQQRVVTKIEELLTELEAGVKELEAAQVQLKLYRDSVLAAACSGKLVATEAEQARAEGRSYETGALLLERTLKERRQKWNGRGMYREPHAPQTVSLPELPEGWLWSNVEQLADGSPHALKAGPFGSALKKDSYVYKGYKIYGQEQVIRGDANFGSYFVDKQKYQELISCAVKPGDILISLVGTIGKVLILPDNACQGIINPRLIKISLERKVCNPAYLKQYLESSSSRQFLLSQSHGQTMDVLNLKIIRNLPVPLPPPREQDRIVLEVERRLSAVDEIAGVLASNLQRSEHLRQSILQQAFAGRLVEQDASDEPAIALLERINVARVGIAPERKVTSKTNVRATTNRK